MDEKEREIADLKARLATYEGTGFGKPPSGDAPNPETTKGVVGCLLGGVVIVIGGLWLLSTCSNASTPKSACDDDTMAYVMSQEFVERRLKAPRTAKFPTMGGPDVVITKTGHCEFTVRAHVDAENSFGAMLRNDYVAILQAPETGDTWTVKSLLID